MTKNAQNLLVSTHSRPKAAGWSAKISSRHNKFQHTAARRRLGGVHAVAFDAGAVSTHSRPKAAGYIQSL